MYRSPLARPFLLIITTILISTSIPVFASLQTGIEKKLAALEATMKGQVGVFAMNTANNQHLQYRANERFPVQSTFKVMAISAILKQSMNNKHLLQQKITYSKNDLVYWSPITEKHLAEGMTIAELCAAAMSYSDNTATNLIVKKLGGPKAVTAFARSINDKTFRIDNWEPELNSNPSKIQDTSTPKAMEKSLQKLTLGNVLASPQREQLVTWMKGNTTGDKRIRAGVLKGWTVADKTGSGSYGIANDIGIIWPPNCAPLVVAIYSMHNKKDARIDERIIALATRHVIGEFAKTDQCVKRNLINFTEKNNPT